MVFTLANLDTFVFAVDEEDGAKKYERETLSGLDGVKVHVEPLKPERGGYELDTTRVKTDVELKLRLAGIKVLSHEEWLQSKGNPCISLTIKVAEYPYPPGSWVFSANLQLVEFAFLLRKPSERTVITWQSGGYTGITTDISAAIRAEVKDQADKFINAYLAANPK